MERSQNVNVCVDDNCNAGGKFAFYAFGLQDLGFRIQLS